MTIGIVGLGLIGGSFAKAYSDNDEHKVLAYNRSKEVIQAALQIFDMIFGNIFLVAHLVLQTRPEIHRDRTELYFHVDQFLCIL